MTAQIGKRKGCLHLPLQQGEPENQTMDLRPSQAKMAVTPENI